MFSKQTLCGVVMALAIAPASNRSAFADANDFEFVLFKSEFSSEVESTVIVKLIDRRTGSLAPDAVVFATRFDMAPDAMETMTTNVVQEPSLIPGQYVLKATPTMAGNWRLSIAAKVQGELETFVSRIVLEVEQ